MTPTTPLLGGVFPVSYMLTSLCGGTMILDEQPTLNTAELRNELQNLALGQQDIPIDLSDLDIDDFSDYVSQFVDSMQVYRGAMHEVSTKLEILDDEYHVRYEHNPIHHMERRIKSAKSIFGKLKKRHLPQTIEAMQNNIYDIAGIRVICNYIDDVYAVANMLSGQSDIEIMEVKDYISHPKESGYRSLHMIYRVPVFLTTGPRITPVEVQFRTIAMDYWASLEHKLRYKGNLSDDQIARHSGTLQECASTLAQVEGTMQFIHRDIIDSHVSEVDDIDLTPRSYTVIRDED